MQNSILASVARATNVTASPDFISKDVIDAAMAEGRATGLAEGRKTERQRLQAILTSEAAKDRRDLAKHLAYQTDMDADAAIDALQQAMKVTPIRPNLAERLSRAGTSRPVGPDGLSGPATTRPVMSTAEIYERRMIGRQSPKDDAR